MAHSRTPTMKNIAECTMPLHTANAPYVAMPVVNDLPVEPTSAKPVIVVPNTLMSSMNEPMDRLATK